MKEEIRINEYRVGLSNECCNSIFTSQPKGSMWCWAASIEMVLKSYNINNLDQQFFVDLSIFNNVLYDCYLDCTNTFQNVASLVNEKTVKDSNNFMRKIFAKAYKGLPNVYLLIEELKNEKPVILRCIQKGAIIGHAVVLTNIEYKVSILDNKPHISKIYVLDPATNKQANLRGIEYSGEDAGRMITDFLVIHIYIPEFY